jgi:monofunctional biosynthetic peptidoglycan transglycosylase
MQARMEQLRARDREAKLRHAWVPYDRIAASLKRAVVVAEDAKFSTTRASTGKRSRRRARRTGRRAGSWRWIDDIAAAGEEPLPLGERSAWRKGQEALITVMIEHVMDKRRILEIYLNVIEWGEGVFGARRPRAITTACAPLARRRAGRAARGDGAEPALLRPQPQHRFLARATQTILARMPAAELP